MRMVESKTRTCYFCGKEGILGDDIWEEPTYEGYEKLVFACRATKECLARRETQQEQYRTSLVIDWQKEMRR